MVNLVLLTLIYHAIMVESLMATNLGLTTTLKVQILVVKFRCARMTAAGLLL